MIYGGESWVVSGRGLKRRRAEGELVFAHACSVSSRILAGSTTHIILLATGVEGSSDRNPSLHLYLTIVPVILSKSTRTEPMAPSTAHISS